SELAELTAERIAKTTPRKLSRQHCAGGCLSLERRRSGRSLGYRRGGGAAGWARGRAPFWGSPERPTFSLAEPRVTDRPRPGAGGAPGVSDTAAPRRPERSTATSWPSSARTTSSWPATECTAPRTSDQRDVLAGLPGAVTDGGDGSDGGVVLSAVTFSL